MRPQPQLDGFAFVRGYTRRPAHAGGEVGVARNSRNGIKADAQPLASVRDGGPSAGIGQRIALERTVLAGENQFRSSENAVERMPLNAGTFCHHADGRERRPMLDVQVNGGLDDALSGAACVSARR